MMDFTIEGEASV